jgi:integral membrane protein (TIGR01906 family)
MSGKKNGGGLLALIAGFVLIMVILLTVIEHYAFDLDFFQSEYRKLKSTEVIGISEQDLMDTTQELLAYIKGERNDLSIEAVIKGEQRLVFNEREIRHMVDVQRLYAVSHSLRNGGVLFLFLLWGAIRYLTGSRYYRYWAGGYLAAAVLFFILLGGMALAISRDFLWFWNGFHYLVFTNDLWQLYPETDILIQMVPEQFFFDLVLRILSFFTVVMTGLAVVAGVILLKKRNKVGNIS